MVSKPLGLEIAPPSGLILAKARFDMTLLVREQIFYDIN